jgi:uncharacterized FlaG/YvyC family protein
MRIDTSTPAIDVSGITAQNSIGILSQNRQVIQAARIVNASDSLGPNELTFSLDPQSHRAIIKSVDRETQDVGEQFQNEEVLRLAESLKTAE